VSEGEDLEEKKLLGYGSHAFAKLTKQEEIKASLGVPQIFLGNDGVEIESESLNLSKCILTHHIC
jgi:hypothetical protein